jgi:hypothetical protein
VIAESVARNMGQCNFGRRELGLHDFDMITARTRGRVLYIAADGTETGCEDFLITRNRDGGRTLRADCEMWDERVVRDVTQTVDAHWRPTEAYVRIAKGEMLRGSGWFRFTPALAECEALTSRDGRVHQRVTLDEPVCGFGSHPVVGDGWQSGALHRLTEPGSLEIFTANSSSEPDGASGPLLGFSRKRIDYLGDEALEVPAGRFDCLRYDIHLAVRDWPPLAVWVTGEDRVLVRLTWTVTDSRYDLVELRED